MSEPVNYVVFWKVSGAHKFETFPDLKSAEARRKAVFGAAAILGVKFAQNPTTAKVMAVKDETKTA